LVTCSCHYCHKVKTKTPGGNIIHPSYPILNSTYRDRYQFIASAPIILPKGSHMLFTALPKQQYDTWVLFAHLLEWQYHLRLRVQQHWIVVEYQRHWRVLAGCHFVSGQDVSQSGLNLHQAESHSWNKPVEPNYLSREMTACNVVLSSHTIFFTLLNIFTIFTNYFYPHLLTTCFICCFPYHLGKYFPVICRCRACPSLIRNGRDFSVL